ncbi:uncharacterized protein [Cicer arietinum]|uniref:uncharacterized protein isoform X2 n=1 Tax=Cicer arietinum TaxID=3827 RepID=UPI003CC687F4
MVHVIGSRNLRSESASYRENVPMTVKFEIEDSIEEEHAPLNKRCKISSSSHQQWSVSNDASLSSSALENSILDEPSPLGLRLKKSHSFLDLIETMLSKGNNSDIANTKSDHLNSGLKKETRGAAAAASGSNEKLKASNFPATLLRIGSWEYKSKYEGDLVAKCYFAKHKLVWEVLEGELKSKIEIQWSDIMALKANCPEDGPSSLTVVVGRHPLFFRETNPQPRKHTLWQSTSDFTDGQASKHRQHFLQCPQGMLTKHFEKLIQCDIRLKFLSQQPVIILDSPYFDPPSAALDKPDILKDCDLHQVNGKGSAMSRFQNTGSPHSSLSPSFTIEHSDPSGITLDSMPSEAPSTSSVMDYRATEGTLNSEADSKDPRNLDHIKLPGLRPSMSVNDLFGQIEEIISGNSSLTDDKLECQQMLEEIAQHLLNDNQVAITSDEKSLMSRVNSLCCLLQKDPAAVPNPHDGSSSVYGPNDGKSSQLSHDFESMQANKFKIDIKAAEEESRDVSGGKQAPGMSRKDSFGELLLNLPRIASLPKFLFNISE